MTVKRAYIDYCPICGDRIELAGIAENLEFTEPFFGPKGSRHMVCRIGAHAHFRITANGRISNRYAYLKVYAAPKG
jgi:hypothetical protein